FQAEDGIRVGQVTGVQTCALPIYTDAAGVAVVHSSHLDPAGVGVVEPAGGIRVEDAQRRVLGDALETLQAFEEARVRLPPVGDEIGRASCREREEMARGDECIEE